MRLTQIKLAGFKSFVDPTTIPTPSQLVGVVGPNGCGKSNIIDAVRWVLGESKASELRGESMQDVIFNGSVNRKPAGRASVELVFDNSEGRVPGQWGAYAEISVRRVLTRDGTSSYYINGQQVRRRDIHDIFLGTGLGARGYAIIESRMINHLIEARPEELRVFLEEAAGVSRYKERRRETSNRLADTRENLVRVEDITRELAANLEKLEAQAEVARLFRRHQEEGELKQHMLWMLRDAPRTERQQKAVAIEQAQAELESAMAAMRAGEAALESRRQAHYAASDAVHAAQGRLYEAAGQVSRLEAEIKHVSDSRNRLQARRQQLVTQQEEWQQQQAHCATQLDELEIERETAAAKTEELSALVDDAREAMPDVESSVRRAADERDRLRVELGKVEQALALAAQAQRDADRQIQALDQRRERLQEELGSLHVPDAALIERLAGDCSAVEEQLEEAQAQYVELEERLPALEDARREAQRASQEENRKLAGLEARFSALERLQEDVQKQGALQPWLEGHGMDTLGRLWQRLQIESGWETALEAVMRERMAAIELRTLEHAVALHSDAPPARLAFYQLPAAASVPTPQLPLRPLSSLLKVNDPDLRALLNDWLYDVYLCDSLEEAVGMRDRLPSGCLLVVAQGHVVDRHSIRFTRQIPKQAGLLARQQEMENLQRDVRAQRLICDHAASKVAETDTAWRQASDAMGPARLRVAEITTRLHDLRLEHSRLRQLADQAGERESRLRTDLEEIHIQTEELAAIRVESEERFEAMDEQLAEWQTKLADAEISGEELHAKAEAARARFRELERQAQEAEYAERSLQARHTELTRNQQLAAEQERRAAAELEGLQGELFELDAAAAEAGLQDALEHRAACEEALAQARLELDNIAATLRGADEDRLRIERSLEPLRTRITELQLQEQAARLAVEQFAEQLNAVKVDRAELRRILAEQSEEWQRVGWLQSEVQRLSRAIEALGPVNLAALDELTAARDRKNYLDSQHADLLAAIDTLEDAIRKIDRESRQLLQDTFNAVNEHFGDLFPRLFGGGEAKLIITGEDLLDAGVQVMAQPPGKRNSTIHLLSGGEKALTATALVFALFKLNPAPFCLLDEVDAPLDDANTERYASLVKSMSEHTQFLFISHNKIAMQMARQLIGVTMQEQGVSRIVAVDIDSALQLAEA